jgi:hypothetical protein
MFRLADAARVQEETNLQLSELEVSYDCFTQRHLHRINTHFSITTRTPAVLCLQS